MDYRLRRQPDGTVNAQPGDAVEVWIELTTTPQWYRGIITKTNQREISVTLDNGVRLGVDYAHVRHARGGAGWHRLREARLRAVCEALAGELENWQQGHIKPYGGLIGSALEALADLDSAETEA